MWGSLGVGTLNPIGRHGIIRLVEVFARLVMLLGRFVATIRLSCTGSSKMMFLPLSWLWALIVRKFLRPKSVRLRFGGDHRRQLLE